MLPILPAQRRERGFSVETIQGGKLPKHAGLRRQGGFRRLGCLLHNLPIGLLIGGPLLSVRRGVPAVGVGGVAVSSGGGVVPVAVRGAMSVRRTMRGTVRGAVSAR